MHEILNPTTFLLDPFFLHVVNTLNNQEHNKCNDDKVYYIS